jgi:hypothetical protein
MTPIWHEERLLVDVGRAGFEEFLEIKTIAEPAT